MMSWENSGQDLWDKNEKLFCLFLDPLAGAFATFFNKVWEKKPDSETEYAKFLTEQHLRQTQMKHIKFRRTKQDPLPEPPSKKTNRTKNDSPRRRSYSDRLALSPKSHHRLSESALPDPDISPYAVGGNTKKGNIYEEAHTRNDMQPYATSTPNPVFVSIQKPQAGDQQSTGNTPTRSDVWEKRPGKKESYYASVNFSKKRLSRKSDDSSMDDSEVNLIENSLYANKNLSKMSHSGESSEEPPPLPQRNYNLREEFPPAADANGLSNHIEDEGYSTIPSNHQRTDRPYESVQQRPVDNSQQDPSTFNFKDKIKLFEREMKYDLLGDDVWVKMNLSPSEHLRASFPELPRRGAEDDLAPLAQQEVHVRCNFSYLSEHCIQPPTPPPPHPHTHTPTQTLGGLVCLCTQM